MNAARFLYLLVGIDLLTDGLAHASRYDRFGFNVAHFDWLTPFTHGGPLLLVGILSTTALLCLCCAFSQSLPRALRVACAFGYTLAWVITLLDAYQHHYLISLLLVLFAVQKQPQKPPLLALFAVVYAWAAVTKLDAHWLSGGVLAVYLPGIPAPNVLSVLALITEVVLALSLLVAALWQLPRWVRALVLLLGLAFHGGIALMPLNIGLFSFYMMGLLALTLFDWRDVLLPRWWSRVGLVVVIFAVLIVFGPARSSYHAFDAVDRVLAGDHQGATTAYERAQAAALLPWQKARVDLIVGK